MEGTTGVGLLADWLNCMIVSAAGINFLVAIVEMTALILALANESYPVALFCLIMTTTPVYMDRSCPY